EQHGVDRPWVDAGSFQSNERRRAAVDEEPVANAIDEDARLETTAIAERISASDEADARHSVGSCSNGVMRSIARYTAYGSGGAATPFDGTELTPLTVCAARSASCCRPSARSACGYELRSPKMPCELPIARPFSNAATASSNMPNEYDASPYASHAKFVFCANASAFVRSYRERRMIRSFHWSPMIAFRSFSSSAL